MTLEKDDTVLPLKISPKLMELIEYIADEREESVDEAMRAMLEEIVEIERVRQMTSAQSRLEQKALFGTRKAKRTAADAWESVMAAWRARRSKKTGSDLGIAILAIEVAASRMEEIQYLADRHNLVVQVFAFGLINEIVDIVHERSMSDKEAALRRRSADPALTHEQRLAARRKALAIWQQELSAWRAERKTRLDRPTNSRRKRRGRRAR